MKIKIHNNKKLDLMVQDLLTRYPKGVNGNVDRDDYTMRNEYISTAGVYRDVPMMRRDSRFYETHKYWGYSTSDMIQVKNRISADRGIRTYLYSVDEDAGSKAISRRENVLAFRVEQGARAFKNESGPGIWNVRVNYDSSVHVIANSKDSAKMIGRAMLAGCGITAKNEYDVRADRINVPSIETCSHYNSKSLSQATGQLADSIKEIERGKKKVTSLNLLIEALTEFGQSQVEMLRSQ